MLKTFVASGLVALLGFAAVAPGVASAAPRHHGHKVCHWDKHHHHKVCRFVRR